MSALFLNPEESCAPAWLPNQLASVLLSVDVKASYVLFCMLQNPIACIVHIYSTYSGLLLVIVKPL